MSLVLDLARASAAINVVLLLALARVWMVNYRQIRSKHTLGTLLFTVFLLAENALALYYYLFGLTGLGLPAPAIQAMMYLQMLETFGYSFLTWVTYT
jgi:hypothetical protein